MRVDQWGIYFTGAILGMALPAMLYVTFIPEGTDIRGLGVAAALAEVLGTRGVALGLFVAFLGAWVLFKTQLDILDAMTRGITNILWTGSRRLRASESADVRVVYYSVLAAVVVWGVGDPTAALAPHRARGHGGILRAIRYAFLDELGLAASTRPPAS